MKTQTMIVTIVVLLIFSTASHAASGRTSFSAGMRYHTAHSSFEDLPFDDGDLSYGLAYEYAEQNAYWQLGLLYTPDLDARDDIDYVLTPQINLIFHDGIWRAGLGGLSSYLETDADDADWTDIYWQFMAGATLDVGGFELDLLAYYPFERWGDIDEFDTDDLEYGAWLRFQF